MKSTSIRPAIARIALTASNTGPHTAASILPRGLPVLLLFDPPPLFVLTTGVLAAVAVAVGMLVAVLVGEGDGDGDTVGDGLAVGVIVTVPMVIAACARNAPVAASEAITVADAMVKFAGR